MPPSVTHYCTTMESTEHILETSTRDKTVFEPAYLDLVFRTKPTKDSFCSGWKYPITQYFRGANL